MPRRGGDYDEDNPNDYDVPPWLKDKLNNENEKELKRRAMGLPPLPQGIEPPAMIAAPENYDVIRVDRVGTNLVLEVVYLNCTRSSFGGRQVMVFVNITEFAAIRWRKIDPRFRNTASLPNEAPSPVAMFPPTPEGWNDALEFAKTKMAGAHPKAANRQIEVE